MTLRRIDYLIKKRKPDHIVKLLRNDCEMSQYELADILDITQATLSRYEQHKVIPSPQVIKRIVDFAASKGILVTIDDFF